MSSRRFASARLLALLAATLVPASTLHAFSIINVQQRVSLNLDGFSIGGDEADYYPEFGELDMGPVMTSDTRSSGSGSRAMAGYLNFAGLSAVEARFSDIAVGNQNSAFSEYLMRIVNDGDTPEPIKLQVDVLPGSVNISDAGGTAENPVRSILAFNIGVSDPAFAFSQPSVIWNYSIELIGPSDAPTTVVDLTDPTGLGGPSNSRSTVNGSVTEQISAYSMMIDLGVLQPGQDIAFRCSTSTRVLGNVAGTGAGGHAKLGDPFGFINGTPGSMGSSCAIQVVPLPAAIWLFGSALGLLGWLKRRAG